MLRPSGRDSTGRTLTELGIEDYAMFFILIAPFYILHERYSIYNKYSVSRQTVYAGVYSVLFIH